MKVDLVATYGALSHEFEPVYSVDRGNPLGDLQKVVSVEIPPEFAPYRTNENDIAVTLDGARYLLNDLLTTRNKRPAMFIPSPTGYIVRYLTIVHHEA